jgi:glycine/D-amino acid oxidase-like deaminating enzyme
MSEDQAMTDTNLDRAAKMAGYNDWPDADRIAPLGLLSLIRTNAATLDELDAAKAELEAFRREVSDALRIYSPENRNPALGRFILPKPDPLVEALSEIDHAAMRPDECAKELRAALAKRGGRIVFDEEKAGD